MSLNAKSLFSLEHRVAVITGASGFLGRTLARTLLENGATVIMLGGRSRKLGVVLSELRRDFDKNRVHSIPLNLNKRVEYKNALSRIARRWQRIDILVNNAHDMSTISGFNSADGTLERADYQQWLANFSGGVFWPALAVQSLAPALKKSHGSIINVASMYALVAPSPRLYEGKKFLNPPGYSAAKAGMLALTRYVASFWGREGVRCNALIPGAFSNTQYAGPNAVQKEDDFLKRLADRTCLGRVGKPQDLAGALLFLASDASSYVTGQTVVVDGGWTIT